MRFHILLLAIAGRLASAALPPVGWVPEGPETPSAPVRRWASLPPLDDQSEQAATLRRRQLAPDQVTQSTQAIRLWADNGPTHVDVRQLAVVDCWLAAASLAVILASSDWMTHILQYRNGTSMAGSINPTVSEAQIQLWDPSNLGSPRIFPVTTFNQSKTEDTPGDRWWNSAVMQGIIQLGAVTPIGGVYANNASVGDLGDACAAMTAMTGYASEYQYQSAYTSPEALFTVLSKAWANRTPIVVSTLPNTTFGDKFADSPFYGASALYGYHAYAVMWTVPYANGTQTVVFRNPWNITVEARITDVYDHMNRVCHLKDFQELNWDKAFGGGQQGATTSSSSVASPTSTPGT